MLTHYMCGGASILMTYYEKEIQYLEIDDDDDDDDDDGSD